MNKNEERKERHITKKFYQKHLGVINSVTPYLCNKAGPDMKARELPQQKTEGAIAVRALNRITSLGMPTSVKVK